MPTPSLIVTLMQTSTMSPVNVSIFVRFLLNFMAVGGAKTIPSIEKNSGIKPMYSKMELDNSRPKVKKAKKLEKISKKAFVYTNLPLGKIFWNFYFVNDLLYNVFWVFAF